MKFSSSRSKEEPRFLKELALSLINWKSVSQELRLSPPWRHQLSSESNNPYIGDNSTSRSGEAGRFNLFTGYQTFSQRHKSFEVCYVAFWDEITLSMQEAQEQRVDEHGFIGKWRIVIVKDLPFTDQRLNGKIPKMLTHRLFPGARFSIWVDSKSQFRRGPLGVIEAVLWQSNSVLAISEHGARGSVYDEAKAVVKKNKATPEEVEVQITQYRKDGLPEEKRLMKRKVLKDINMFPVCTRKDLVNSMGHVRKAKPLINLARSK